MPSGQHALELTSVLNGVESDRSSPLFVTVGGAAATTAISSLDMRAAPANSTTICAGNPQTDCYNVQVIASGLGAVTGLTPIPDGRVMFIEDGQQIRIVVRDSVRAVVALPFEVGRQLTGLTLDTKFETSGSVFVAWSELDSRVPGLNITRYRELGNVLAEGATIATALPSAVDVATPLAVDDEGLVYVAVPVNPDKPVPHFLSGGGVVMRFDRDGLVPRSNQHGSPIVAAGYPVPLVLTIDRPNRKVWLTGRDYGQLAAISAFGLQALSRGPWPHEPVVIEGLGKGEQIESVAISNQAATADAESELLIATAGRLRKVTLTQRATIASLSNIPVGDGFFVRNVATGGDGAAYVSATLRDGSTLVLRLTRLST
jgi:hypothetical protein